MPLTKLTKINKEILKETMATKSGNQKQSLRDQSKIKERNKTKQASTKKWKKYKSVKMEEREKERKGRRKGGEESSLLQVIQVRLH